MSNSVDKEKVYAASKGDVDAFADLFEELRPMVYSIAIKYVGETDANDVVMDTYLKAWKAIPKFKFKSSLKTWIFRITFNCSHDYLKRINREHNRTVRENDDQDPILDRIADDNKTPDQQAAKNDVVKIVRESLKELPDEFRITLMMRYCNDMSYSDIAAATGVKLGTVMSRLFNGKRKLKLIMKQYSKE
jgi:RNA polymerase sigma-70 factor, ECF subfamily